MPVATFGSHESSMPSPPRNDENYSPSEVALAPPYYSLNPGLFDSVEHWKYRDLQKLAKTLGIAAAGKRADVVARLQEYHREKRSSGQAGMFHSVEFNMVKLIPAKEHSEMYGQYREPSWDDADDDEEDEEDEVNEK